MPSVARVLRPRCLRWLLLENRSCEERESEREGGKEGEEEGGVKR